MLIQHKIALFHVSILKVSKTKKNKIFTLRVYLKQLISKIVQWLIQTFILIAQTLAIFLITIQKIFKVVKLNLNLHVRIFFHKVIYMKVRQLIAPFTKIKFLKSIEKLINQHFRDLPEKHYKCMNKGIIVTSQGQEIIT